MPARKNAAAAATTTAVAKDGALKVRMTLVIEVPDAAKWELDGAAKVETAPVVEALTAQGVPAETAKELAAKAVEAAAKTGPNAIRDAIREYVLAEARKLEKIAAVKATITVAKYAAPAKKTAK